MSNTEPTELGNEVDPNEPQGIKDLREAANRGRAEKERADGLARELAFTKAGIDTDKGWGALLLKSYDGEPTKDAVLAAAKEHGFLTEGEGGEAAPTEEELALAEKDRQEQTAEAEARARAAGDSSFVDPATAPGAKQAAMTQYNKALGEMPREDAQAEYFKEIVRGAANNDPSVVMTNGGMHPMAGSVNDSLS